MNRRARDAQTGAAAVEFALILPLFMTLVMGCIDWGWYFYIDQVCTNAAREGARTGSMETSSDDAASVAEEIAEDYLQRMGLGGYAAAVTASAPVGDPPAVEVEIEYPVGSLTGFLTALMPENATAKAVMRIEP